MVAPSCRVWLDRRFMPDEDPHRLAADLVADVDAGGITGDGISVDVEVTMAMPSAAPDQPWAIHWRRASAMGSSGMSLLSSSGGPVIISVCVCIDPGNPARRAARR